MIKEHLKNVSLVYIIIPLVLTIIGVIFIFSTGINPDGTNSGQFIRQLIWIAIGLGLAVLVLSIDYYQLVETSEYYYIAGIVFLIFTLLFGRVIRGSRSWLGYGGMGIQPSEIMKIFFILMFAKFLGKAPEKEKSLRTFLISLALIAVPLGLILIQPDLGTSIVFIVVFIVMCVMGINKIKYSVYLLSVAGVTGFMVLTRAYYEFHYIEHGGLPMDFLTILFSFEAMVGIAITMFIIAAIAFVIDLFRPLEIINKILPIPLVIGISFAVSAVSIKLLKPYQWRRLLVFLNPEFDRWGAGYNIIQSKIAVGSGGFLGKGLFRGTQNTLGFLPEKNTDFIFSIISEELGFLGSGLIILLFLVYFYFIIRLIKEAKDKEGKLVASGILAMYFTHFAVNVGMTLGIAPVTGLPLPFISYGGSSFLACIIGASLLANIHSRRFVH
jgi:rod shape determining protein RodA